jgi:hypothetical protein
MDQDRDLNHKFRSDLDQDMPIEVDQDVAQGSVQGKGLQMGVSGSLAPIISVALVTRVASSSPCFSSYQVRLDQDQDQPKDMVQD